MCSSDLTIDSAQEHPLLVKTRPELADAVEAEFTRLHPYDVTAILRIAMDANAAYLDWIAAETTPPDRRPRAIFLAKHAPIAHMPRATLSLSTSFSYPVTGFRSCPDAARLPHFRGQQH